MSHPTYNLSSPAKAQAQVSSTPRLISPISEAQNAFDGAMEEHFKVLSQLEACLYPVLSPVPPQTPDEGCEATPVPQHISAYISVAAGTLNQMTNYVSALLNRLEL